MSYMKDALGRRLDSLQVAEQNVADVGRDVIGLLGQSNVVGGGSDTIDTTNLDPTSPRIWQWPASGPYSGQWIIARDGLYHLYQSATVGPGMPFARDYLKRCPSNREVGLVPCGIGSTGFTPAGGYTWDPADTTTAINLYRNAVSQLRDALANAGPNARLAGIVWSQGEQDVVSMTQTQYAAKLDLLITSLRTEFADPNLPVIIGPMVPSWYTGTPSREVIEAAKRDTPSRLPRVGFVEGITGSQYVQPDLIHFNAKGNRLLGALLADGFFNQALTNQTGVTPVAPTSVTLTQSGTSVTASWSQPRSRATDYLIEYKVGAGAWTTFTHTASITRSATLTGLTLGATLNVRVSTVNEVGTSAPSAVAVLVLDNLPGQVTGLTAPTTTTSTSQQLSWNTVSAARSYLVEYKKNADVTWGSKSVSGVGTTIIGLSANTTYNYRVSAVNGAGAGTVSSTVNAATLAATPLSTSVGIVPVKAYGQRRLVAGYSGPAIRVRRSSDNVEQDIALTAGDDLDTAALTTFVGANSGFVTKWYNQGSEGAASDMAQAVQANQPRIVNAGVVDVTAGKAAPVFDGSNDHLFGTSPGAFAAAAVSMLMVAELVGTAANYSLYQEDSTTGGTAKYMPFNKFGGQLNVVPNIRNDANTQLATQTAAALGITVRQVSWVEGSGNWSNYQEGSPLTTGSVTTTSTATFNRHAVSANFHTGRVCEVAVFHTELTAGQRQAGEANQKGYWSTPAA